MAGQLDILRQYCTSMKVLPKPPMALQRGARQPRRVRIKPSLTPWTARDEKRLTRLVRFCEGLPGFAMTPVGERHLALGVGKKTFGYYLHDHHGDGKVCVCCKSTPARQQQLVSACPGRFYVPAYLGRNGWVSLRMDQPSIDWDEAFEIAMDAYRLQAPARLLAKLD